MTLKTLCGDCGTYTTITDTQEAIELLDIYEEQAYIEDKTWIIPKICNFCQMYYDSWNDYMDGRE